jgi:hypothetical protein
LVGATKGGQGDYGTEGVIDGSVDGVAITIVETIFCAQWDKNIMFGRCEYLDYVSMVRYKDVSLGNSGNAVSYRREGKRITTAADGIFDLFFGDVIFGRTSSLIVGKLF